MIISYKQKNINLKLNFEKVYKSLTQTIFGPTGLKIKIKLMQYS